MLIVTIDLGSYSTKVVESRLEKKKIKHINKFEFVLDQDRMIENIQEIKAQEDENKNSGSGELEFYEKMPYLKYQIKSVKKYLEAIPPHTKVLFQCPIHLCSSRFLEVPVKSKKKADAMIPFQLEEDMPYSLNDVHLSTSTKKSENGFKSISSYIHKKTFELFHKYLKDQNALPTYLATEVSTWNEFISKSNKFPTKEPFAIIDLGHSKSVAYFFKNKELVSYSVTFFGGEDINEMIMSEYDVDVDKAIEFKHQNAFFLTSNQLDDVDDKQKEFSENMTRCIQGFITDYKRSELALRVHQQVNISNIYLCGGTAKVKNIENYLSEQFQKPVDFLQDYQNNFESTPLERFDYLSFANINALKSFYLNKTGNNNFLTGEYSNTSSEDVPVHSISFVGLRTAILCLLFCAGFLFESSQLTKQEKKVNKSVKAVLGNTALGFSKAEISGIRKKPEKLLKRIQNKIKDYNKGISQIKTSTEAKGLKGLFKLIAEVNTKCELTEYSDDYDGQAQATFSECESNDILRLEALLKSKGLYDAGSSSSNPNQGRLTAGFQI